MPEVKKDRVDPEVCKHLALLWVRSNFRSGMTPEGLANMYHDVHARIQTQLAKQQQATPPV